MLAALSKLSEISAIVVRILTKNFLNLTKNFHDQVFHFCLFPLSKISECL